VSGPAPFDHYKLGALVGIDKVNHARCEFRDRGGGIVAQGGSGVTSTLRDGS